MLLIEGKLLPCLSYSLNASFSSFCKTSSSSFSKKLTATLQNDSKFKYPVPTQNRNYINFVLINFSIFFDSFWFKRQIVGVWNINIFGWRHKYLYILQIYKKILKLFEELKEYFCHLSNKQTLKNCQIAVSLLIIFFYGFYFMVLLSWNSSVYNFFWSRNSSKQT